MARTWRDVSPTPSDAARVGGDARRRDRPAGRPACRSRRDAFAIAESGILFLTSRDQIATRRRDDCSRELPEVGGLLRGGSILSYCSSARQIANMIRPTIFHVKIWTLGRSAFKRATDCCKSDEIDHGRIDLAMSIELFSSQVSSTSSLTRFNEIDARGA